MNEQEAPSCQTLQEFLVYVRRTLLPQAKQYPGDLGQYLRSLLGIIEEYATKPATFSLFALCLTDAFHRPPLTFDSLWLAYTDPPLDPDQYSSSFDRLQGMLRYQVADWHRMEEAGILQNEYRYLGVQSPTGHSWYNFDLYLFLECGTAGMGFNRAEDMKEGEYIVLSGGIDIKGLHLVEHEAEMNIEIAPNWEIFASLLWVGQIYE